MALLLLQPRDFGIGHRHDLDDTVNILWLQPVPARRMAILVGG